MPGLPTSVSVGTITGTLKSLEQIPASDAAPDSQPITGNVIFTASPKSMLDSADDVILVPKPIVVALDVNGHFSTQLAATNDTDLNPTNWTYMVSFELVGGYVLDPFAIEVLAGLTRDLADVAPVPDSEGVFYVSRPVTEADLPPGSVMYSGTTTRPTARTDIMVIFTSVADPSANALVGDRWFH